MSDFFEIQEAIERQRNPVDAMILNGIDDETFYRENVKLDRLLELYIDMVQHKKEE